jgi:hypothetical protein
MNGKMHAKVYRDYRQSGNRLEKETQQKADIFYDDHQILVYFGGPIRKSKTIGKAA